MTGCLFLAGAGLCFWLIIGVSPSNSRQPQNSYSSNDLERPLVSESGLSDAGNDRQRAAALPTSAHRLSSSFRGDDDVMTTNVGHSDPIKVWSLSSFKVSC